MKPIENEKSKILPGMKIRLIDGHNVPMGNNHRSYDWESPEVVDHIDGEIIIFKDCPTVTWYTINMPWEIIK